MTSQAWRRLCAQNSAVCEWYEWTWSCVDHHVPGSTPATHDVGTGTSWTTTGRSTAGPGSLAYTAVARSVHIIIIIIDMFNVA